MRAVQVVRLLLLAIVLFAFAARTYRAGDLLMWGDEGYSVYSANRSISAITFEGIDVDPHPPLYYYLLHFYLSVTGNSEFAARFFSIFFGVAAIPLLYTIGKKMFDARVGVVAVAFAAIAPFDVHYSQEIRMYALVIFLSALSLFFFLKLLHKEMGNLFHSAIGNPQSTIEEIASSQRALLAMTHGKLWLAYALAMLLTQYSLYQSALIFLAEGLYLLPLFFSRRTFVLKWFAVAFGIVLLFLPWLLFRYHSAVTDVRDVAGETVPMNLFVFLARGFGGMTVGTTIPFANALPLAAIYFTLILLGMFIGLKDRTAVKSVTPALAGGARVSSEARNLSFAERDFSSRKPLLEMTVAMNDALLFTLALVPMLALYPVYYLLPLYRVRLFAVAFVPLALLIARGVILIVRRARFTAIPIAVFILLISLYSLISYFTQYSRYSAVVEDYLPAIRAIEPRAQPGDVVLFHAYWQEGYFLSYYRGAPLEYRALDNAQEIDYALAKPRNVWAIVQSLPIHGGEVALDRAAYLYDETEYGQMRVLSYRADNPARAEKFSPPVEFENGIALLGYRVNGAPIQAGRGIATLELQWQAARKIADDFTISARVTDARGQVISQIDTPPVDGLVPTSAWEQGQVIVDRRGLAIPADASSGDYTIQIVMYQYIDGRVAKIIAPEKFRGETVVIRGISIIGK